MVSIYRSCSRCGKIHDTKYRCKAKNIIYSKRDYDEARLRNTYDWHIKAEQIKKDSNYLCSVCYEEGIYNYNELETHHIEKLKDRPDLLLKDTNLICLCKRHHLLADNEMIDKNYLKELVRKRMKIKI